MPTLHNFFAHRITSVALAENQFELYYQAQSTHDGRIIGAEALISWQHPQRGLIFPDAFIPLTEAVGLITVIGQWVLQTACSQLKNWESNTHTQHLQLAVNVSVRQFHKADFVTKVQQIMHLQLSAYPFLFEVYSILPS